VGDDVVTLVLPRERDFHPVARLVLAGLAARLGLTYENLEDLQIALGGLLDREDREDDVTVRFVVEEGGITTEVGPFEAGDLRAELERDDPGELGLRRLLDTVVDSVELEEDPSGIVVRLVKHVGLAPTQS
jgi:anti-sigma regulatory factor (Ser/Thr protein kinase)